MLRMPGSLFVSFNIVTLSHIVSNEACHCWTFANNVMFSLILVHWQISIPVEHKLLLGELAHHWCFMDKTTTLPALQIRSGKGKVSECFIVCVFYRNGNKSPPLKLRFEKPFR